MPLPQGANPHYLALTSRGGHFKFRYVGINTKLIRPLLNYNEEEQINKSSIKDLRQAGAILRRARTTAATQPIRPPGRCWAAE